MKKQLRSMVVLTGIAVASAFGGTLALAEVGGAPEQGVQGEMRQHKGQSADQRGHRFFKRMAKELGLSEQQKTQAKAVFEKNRELDKPLVESMRSARQTLRKLVHSGSADDAAIREQAAKLAQTEADLAVRRAQGTREFMALLTPDQVTKLKEIRAKKDAKMQKGKGERCDMD